MARKPVLVVMAAGMGSRYGGLKQIDPVGSCGEAILDYSLYDAFEAGFETAVIIIKEAIKSDFMETVGERLKTCPMEIRYAYQEPDMLPDGYKLPEGRRKPWGTTHAVLCAAEAIGDAPFAALNADDYYGKSAYRVMHRFLCSLSPEDTHRFCMVGYELGNTLTDHGSVTRGICETDGQGNLTAIRERKKIQKFDDGIRFLDDDGENWVDVDAGATVSMNMWGFSNDFLQEIRSRFPAFLDYAIAKDPLGAEFLLPTTIERMLTEDSVSVQVLHSEDRWFGVTYAADKPLVVDALSMLTGKGLYPSQGLWNR